MFSKFDELFCAKSYKLLIKSKKVDTCGTSPKEDSQFYSPKGIISLPVREISLFAKQEIFFAHGMHLGIKIMLDALTNN